MSARRWLTVNQSDDSAEIHINGFIGESYWDDSGNSGKEFRRALDSIPKGKKVTVKISSEGGVIKDGLEMYDAISSRRDSVTTHIIGYACSTASWLGLGAGRVITSPNAIWMIHNASGYTYGNAEDHLRNAEGLEKHDQSICGMISKKTGKSVKEIAAAMDKETWFTGEEAAEFGMAEEMECEPEDHLKFSAVNAVPWGKKLCDLLAANAGPKGDKTKNDATEAAPKTIPPVTAPASAASISPVNHGGESGKQAASQKHKPQENMETTTTTAAASPSAEIEALREQAKTMNAMFEKEKRTRVTDKISKLAENKIENKNLGFWIDLAMKGDENAVFSQIEALPVARPGGEPIGAGSVSIADTEMQRIMKLGTAAERNAAWKKADWNALMNDALARGERNETMHLPENPYGFKGRRGMAVNANTYSATLVTSYLLDGATTILQTKLTALMAFTREFSTDPYKPKATHVHKYVDATASTTEDCTDWEPALADTIDPVSVTMHQQTKIFGVSNSDLNSGLRMEDLTRINSVGIAKTIIEKATAPITVANFGTLAGTTGAGAPLVSSDTAFSYAELTQLRAYIKNAVTKNIILDGSYFARITNVPTFYQQAAVTPGGGFRIFGWDFIGENNDWTGAGANIVGFACDPQAILVVAGIPLTPPSVPGNTLQEGRLTIPDVGLTIGAYTWFSLQYRTMRSSFDLMFGAAAMDKTAGTLLKSA